MPIRELPRPVPMPTAEEVEEPTPRESIVEQTATTPSPQAVDDYSAKLRAHISKYKSYPRIAQVRGWQGEAIIEAEIKGDGSLVNAKVSRSSGFPVLDKEAMQMMQRSIPFPIPPETLKNNTFKIFIPIAFSLI